MDSIAAIDILITLLDRTARWSAIMQDARTQNRPITTVEIDSFFSADDVSAKKLAAAIAQAKAEGR